MNPGDLKEFSKLLSAEAELYPQTAKVTAGRIQAYFESLSRFDLETIRAALQALRERSEFFPTIRAVVESLEGSGDDRANQAWSTFLDAASDGGYASVKFLDPATATAVIGTFGGWLPACRALREAEAPMVAHYRKSFVAAYQTARKFPREVETYQAGHYEIQNRAGGAWAVRMQVIVNPVLIVGLRESKELRLPFDASTGRLTGEAQARIAAAMNAEGARQLIEWASGERPQAALGVGVPQLPQSSDPEITHEEAARFVAVAQRNGLALVKPMPGEMEAA